MKQLIPEPYNSYLRVFLLVTLLLISGVYLFGVGGLGQADTGEPQAETGFTTLQFGLDLEGGTRIQAPLHGVTAEQVELDETDDSTEISQAIAERLDTVSVTDVNVYIDFDDAGAPDSEIEVTDAEVTRSELETALEQENIAYETVRTGVTEQTTEETVNVIEEKIDETGLAGATVRQVTAVGGERFVLIEVPGEDRERIISILEDRGVVQVDIYYPEDGEYHTEEAVITEDSFSTINTPTFSEDLGWHVPVELTSEAAQDFQRTAQETGLSAGGSVCTYDTNPESTEACLLTRVDGEIVYSAGMSPDLGGSIEAGTWADSPSFVLQTETQQEAENLAVNLRAGALPAPINFDAGTVSFISPEQGEQFKSWGLFIGLLAIFAVSLKVHYRYRNLRVTIPMIATALSEVIILLGFAAFIGYPIDLAVVGGFIAVIGTGVDDLIIISNEILTKGEIKSNRVFKNRFAKAYWIIGAAALTTIVALSPLIVLGLGELAGFAIFTIIGVLIGVFITRPAYGDILKYLLLDNNR